MIDIKPKEKVVNYKFHHIDTSKCNYCREFSCEEACFRGIYEVINKESKPECRVIEDREDFCVKCHLCSTACRFRAIEID